MNDEATPETAPSDEQPPLFNQAPGVDWLLAHIIGLAERGCSIGITVNVNGLMVTGNAIGGREYFELVSQGFKTANYNNATEGLGEVLESSFAQFKEMYPISKDLPEDYVAQPNYLHLKGAQFLAGPGLTKGNGGIWRFKLTDVSGFLVGTMT